MLKELIIKDFAIIDNLVVDFGSGMIVMTGETGAGKSILIDAIQLVLGQRASTDVIASGKDRAEISVTFDINHQKDVQPFLMEHELGTEPFCILRRIIYRDGRSKSTINDIPVTQQTLRELSEYLIHIHGQHEYQTLLKRDQQRFSLDRLGGHEEVLQKLQTLYKKWKKAKEGLEQLMQSSAEQEAKRTLLTYQLEELHALHLEKDEWERLEQEHRQAANAEAFTQQCQMALTAIKNEDETEGVSAQTLLSKASSALESLTAIYPNLNNPLQNITQASIQIDEASLELQQQLNKTEYDPAQLAQLEERLSRLHETARKHQLFPQQLYDFQQDLEKELNSYEHSSERSQQLSTEIVQHENDYFECAKKLSSMRQKSAKRLAQIVTEHIQNLGMPQGQFQVSFEKMDSTEPQPYGMEKIEFLITTNLGQPLKPLSQVASGGELSRINLAIQVVTAQKDKIPSLIFDEIDMGIGGLTANKVGDLLKELGQMTQVFCITHLPQIAAKGDHHFYIEKRNSANKTTTHLTLLDREKRIEEIARMVGGAKITTQTLAHASELLGSK